MSFKVGDFFVQLGVDTDEVMVKNFVKAIGDIPMAAVEAIGALAGVSFELGHLINQSLDAGLGFKNFERTTGLSTDELQRWQGVAERVGVSAESVKGSMVSLFKNVGAIQLGGGNIKGFQMLGIDPFSGPASILSQLRKAARNMPKDIFMNAVEAMGLSQDIIPLLQLTDAEFKKLGDDVPMMTQKQIEAFNQSKIALTEFGQALKQFGYEFMELFGPAITGIVHLVTKLVKDLGAAFEELNKIFELAHPMKALIEDLKEFMTGNKQTFFGELAKQYQANPSLTPVGMIGTAAAAGKQILNTINITFSSLANPTEAARALVDEIQRRSHGAADMNVGNAGY